MASYSLPSISSLFTLIQDKDTASATEGYHRLRTYGHEMFNKSYDSYPSPPNCAVTYCLSEVSPKMGLTKGYTNYSSNRIGIPFLLNDDNNGDNDSKSNNETVKSQPKLTNMSPSSCYSATTNNSHYLRVSSRLELLQSTDRAAQTFKNRRERRRLMPSPVETPISPPSLPIDPCYKPSNRILELCNYSKRLYPLHQQQHISYGSQQHQVHSSHTNSNHTLPVQSSGSELDAVEAIISLKPSSSFSYADGLVSPLLTPNRSTSPKARSSLYVDTTAYAFNADVTFKKLIILKFLF
jgi:hypothetical protein